VLARTDLNLGSALVCLLIGGVLLAIVWVIDRRQLRRNEAAATDRAESSDRPDDHRLVLAGRGVRSLTSTGADPEVPPVAQELEPTGEALTHVVGARPGDHLEPVVEPFVEPEREPEPEPEREPELERPLVSFTAHAQGSSAVTFLDPSVIDLSDEQPADRATEAEPVATGAHRADPVVVFEAAPLDAPPAEPRPVTAAPVSLVEFDDPTFDDEPAPRRRRRPRGGGSTKPKLPKGAEAALAAIVEVVPDPRNTVKLTRDPTAEVHLTRAERRAVDDARAYQPPVADLTEWETPTEARVQAMPEGRAHHAPADR
jgi:hypothetical protein